jgi:FkbM family methyltransferase
MAIKRYIRAVLNWLGADLTTNLKYDRLTGQLMRQVLKAESNCVDVGCHKGEVLQTMLALAPKGRHYAFEPLPHFYTALKKTYGHKATIYPYALANTAGTAGFTYVKNAPAYSGLKQRRYDVANPQLENLMVETRLLDELIPADVVIDFIKIDVEGGELGVLKGAQQLLLRCKPVVVFECGLGASDYYGTTPEMMFDFITCQLQMKVSLPEAFIRHAPSLSRSAFVAVFNKNLEYYFVAHP